MDNEKKTIRVVQISHEEAEQIVGHPIQRFPQEKTRTVRIFAGRAGEQVSDLLTLSELDREVEK